MKSIQLCASALAGALLMAMLPGSAIASAADASPSASEASPSAGSGDSASTAPVSQAPVSKAYAAKPEEVKSIKLDDAKVNIIGASWKGADPSLEIRHRTGSGWSTWEGLPADDAEGPDPKSAEGRQATSVGAEEQSIAVPIVDATEIQVKSAGTNQKTTDLEINKVTTTVSAEDSRLAKAKGSSPSGGLSAQVYQHELKANIVTRKEWGANEKLVRCKTDKTSSTKGVFIHHTAGSNSYTKAQAPGIIRGYLTYHTKNRGWCDIGYNFLVDKYGTIYEGRAGSINLAVTGAHASGFNSYTTGISVMGTYSGSAPSSAAQNSVKRLIAWKANQYAFNPTGKMTLTSGGGSTSRYPAGKKVSLNVVSGHRDTSYTECPGKSFYAKLGTIRSGAKTLQKTVGGFPTKGAIGTYYRKHPAATGEARAAQKSVTKPNGVYQTFAKGTVYWSSATGAHLNKGGIKSAYKKVKYEKGVLGFPRGEEQAFKYRKKAVYQNFEHGIITYTSTTKGQPLTHGMLSKWKSLGWERSSLGLPTTGEFASKGKTRQNFEKGYMTYKKGEGVKVYVK